MDKYLVKPTKIVDEHGYVYSIDDYVSNNLPCGGSSGSTNNSSIVNEIMNLDQRIETLEEEYLECDSNFKDMTKKILIMEGQISELGSGSTTGTTSFEYTVTQYGCANDMYGYKDYKPISRMVVVSIPDALDVIQSNIAVNKEIISDHTTKIKAINDYDLDYMSREIDDMGRAIYDLEQAISQMSTMSTGGDDLIVIDQQISTLNNRVTLLENNTTTNTTKIGVHTTDISAMLNRIVDLETTVQTQSRLISELTSRIEILESTTQ